MKDISCDIVKDLVALYVDDLVSNDSRKVIEEHIKTCRECKDFLYKIKGEELNILIEEIEVPIEAEKKIVSNIKKAILKSRILFISIGLLIGVLFSIGDNLFKGILIIPLVSTIVYLWTKKSYIAPAIIFIMLCFGMIGWMIINTNGLSFIDIIGTGIYTGVLYSMISVIGVLIGYLIKKIFMED